MSEQPGDSSRLSGTWYLVIRTTSEIEGQSEYADKWPRNGAGSSNRLDHFDHEEWSDIVAMNGTFNYSFSLGFPAWDSARLEVDLFSDNNRSEPQPRFDSALWQRHRLENDEDRVLQR
jgi:hypothetical protein